MSWSQFVDRQAERIAMALFVLLALVLDWGHPVYMPILWVAAGGLILLVSVDLLRRARSERVSFDLQEEGLRYTGSEGQRDVRWEEVTAVRLAITYRTRAEWVGGILRYLFRLELADQQFIEFNQMVGDFLELGRQIEAKTTPVLALPMEERLAAGEVVEFGPIAVTDKWFRVEGRQIGWDELESLRPSAGRVVVKGADRRHHYVSMASVPNLRVLMELAKVRQDRSAPPAPQAGLAARSPRDWPHSPSGRTGHLP